MHSSSLIGASPALGVDPTIAVELILLQAELLRVQAGLDASPQEAAGDDPRLRDLSPLARGLATPKCTCPICLGRKAAAPSPWLGRVWT